MSIKIFDKYLFRQVFAATLVCIFLFVVIWIAPETLLKVIKYTLQGSITPQEAIQLLIYEVPKIIVKALPVGLLLGSLYSFDKLSKDFELTVLRGIGMSFQRIIVPVAALSVVLTVICFSMHNTLIPYSEAKSAKIKHLNYETHFVYNVKADKDKLEKILIIPSYHNHQISSPLVLNFNANQYTDTSVLNSILLADYAVYKNGTWTLQNVKKYQLTEAGVFKSISKHKTVNVLSGENGETAFKLMNYSVKRDRELNNAQITEYIRLLKKENLMDEYRAMLNKYLQRYFHSLICILFAVLGCILGFSQPREQRLVGFTIGIAVVFGYYITIPFFDMCAEKGLLSPWITSTIQPLAILAAIFVFKKMKDL